MHIKPTQLLPAFVWSKWFKNIINGLQQIDPYIFKIIEPFRRFCPLTNITNSTEVGAQELVYANLLKLIKACGRYHGQTQTKTCFPYLK